MDFFWAFCLLQLESCPQFSPMTVRGPCQSSLFGPAKVASWWGRSPTSHLRQKLPRHQKGTGPGPAPRLQLSACRAFEEQSLGEESGFRPDSESLHFRFVGPSGPKWRFGGTPQVTCNFVAASEPRALDSCGSKVQAEDPNNARALLESLRAHGFAWLNFEASANFWALGWVWVGGGCMWCVCVCVWCVCVCGVCVWVCGAVLGGGGVGGFEPLPPTDSHPQKKLHPSAMLMVVERIPLSGCWLEDPSFCIGA